MANFIAYIFFTVTGLAMMKISGQPIEFGLNEGVVYFNISVKMVLALVFYGVSFLLWTGIVVKNDLSFIVPFSSAIVNIIAVGLGICIFREPISIYKVIGILMAVSGIVLMNYK